MFEDEKELVLDDGLFVVPHTNSFGQTFRLYTFAYINLFYMYPSGFKIYRDLNHDPFITNTTNTTRFSDLDLI